MITMQKCVTETSLISSAVLHGDPSNLDGYTAEDANKLIDIPLEGGLLQIEVCMCVFSVFEAWVNWNITITISKQILFFFDCHKTCN